MSTTHGPMHGIRIIDLSTIISGPIATQILGDQGADVIKVEPPGIGDLTRRMGTRRNGLSAIFAAANRNKRGIILDLKSEAGVEILGQIVATADVVVQNFRPGAVERMGIGYDKMRAIKPDIIYASITGFGASGPYSSRRVYFGCLPLGRDGHSGARCHGQHHLSQSAWRRKLSSRCFLCHHAGRTGF